MITVRRAVIRVRKLMSKSMTLLDSWREARVSSAALGEILRKESRKRKMDARWREQELRGVWSREKTERGGKCRRMAAVNCNHESAENGTRRKSDLRVIVDTGFNGLLYIKERTANNVVEAFQREGIELEWSRVNIRVQETSIQQTIQWKLCVPIAFNEQVYIVGALLHPGRAPNEEGKNRWEDAPNLMGIKALRRMNLKVSCGNRNTIEVEGSPDTVVDFGSDLVPQFDFVSPILSSRGMVEVVRKLVAENRGADVAQESMGGDEIANVGKELNQRIQCLRKRGEATRHVMNIRKKDKDREAPVRNKVFLKNSDRENFISLNGQGKSSGAFRDRAPIENRNEVDNIAEDQQDSNKEGDGDENMGQHEHGRVEGGKDEDKKRGKEKQRRIEQVDTGNAKEIVKEFEQTRGNRNSNKTGRYGALESLRLRKYSRRELLLLDIAQSVHKQLGFCGERPLTSKLQQLWLQKDRYFASEAAKVAHATSVEGIAPMGRAVAPRVMSLYSKGLGEWGACDVFFIGSNVDEEQETRRCELKEVERRRFEVASSSTGGPRYNIEKAREAARDGKIATEEKSGVYLMIINVYSRHCGIFPLRDESGKKSSAPDGGAIRRAVLQYAGLNILPKNMLSDNGTEFRNRKVVEMSQAQGAQWHFSASSSARSNGISERRIHAVKLIVSRLSKQNSEYDLDETVQQAASCINAAPSTVLGGWSPNNVQCGTPLDPQFSYPSFDNINCSSQSSREHERSKDAKQHNSSDSNLQDIANHVESRLASRFWFRETYHQVSKDKMEMSIVRRKLDELKARYTSSRGYRVGDLVWVRGKNSITPNNDAVEGVISGICNKSFNTVYYAMSKLSGVTMKCSAKELSLDVAENLDWEMPTQLTRVRHGAPISSLFKPVDPASGGDDEAPNSESEGWVTLNVFPDHPKENALGVIIENQVGSTTEGPKNGGVENTEYQLNLDDQNNADGWDFQNVNSSNQGRHGRGVVDSSESHWVRCDMCGRFRAINLSSYLTLKRARRFHIQCSDLTEGSCDATDDHLRCNIHPRELLPDAKIRIEVSNREHRKEKRRPAGETQPPRRRIDQRNYGKNRDENRVIWTPKKKKAAEVIINRVVQEAAIGEMKVKEHELLLMGDALRKLKGRTVLDKESNKPLFSTLRKLFVGLFVIESIVVVNNRNRIIEVPGNITDRFCLHLHVATNKGKVERCLSKQHKPINATQVTVIYRDGINGDGECDRKAIGKQGSALSGEQFYLNNYPTPSDVEYELKRNGKAAAVPYKRLAKIGLLEQLVQATKTEFGKLTKPRESDGAVVLQKMSRAEAEVYRNEYDSKRKVIPSQMLYDLKLENFPVNQSLCAIKARLAPIGWREDENDARVIGVDSGGRLISDGCAASDAQVECNPFSSPTLSTTQLRIVMQIYASLPRGACFSLDIRRAFLQSAPYPKGDVRWIDAPRNVKGDERLRKEVDYCNGDTFMRSIPLHGLKSASASWYKTLSSFLDTIGFVSSQECPSIFTLTAANSDKLRAAEQLLDQGKKIENSSNPYSQLRKIKKNEVVEEIRREISEVQVTMGKNTVEYNPIDAGVGDAISEAFLPGGTDSNHKLRSSDGEKIVITLATHVDDLLGVCTDVEVQKVFIKVLGSVFAHGNVSILSKASPINYCGKLLSQDQLGILISCPNKASAIQTIKTESSLFLENGLLSPEGIKRYRAVKGMLRFIGQRRPDSAYAIFLISQGSDECRGKDDVRRINKVVRFINQNPYLGHRIIWVDHHFRVVDSDNGWRGVRRNFHLVVMSDAALCVSDSSTVAKMKRDDKLKTVSGFICGAIPSLGDGAHPFGNNPNENLVVNMGIIDANCVSMALSTSSSYAAEARALRNNLCRTQVIKSEFLANKVNIESIFVFTDSSSIATRLASGESSLKIADANCYRDVIFIKTLITNRCFQLNFISDTNNMSDLLTKYHPETNSKHQKYLRLVNQGEWSIEAKSRCGKTSV